ncbi:MAG: GxxExxY protein [Planctomycetota bacterium]
MNTNEQEIIYKELSYQIMNLVFEVHNKLGCGFLEKVHENAVCIKLRKSGVNAIQQAPISVYFEDEIVGEYFADILIEDKIILELKCVDEISDIHRAQVINYLRATNMRLGIIINFAKPKLEYERIVL